MFIATLIKINKRFRQLENQRRERIPYYQPLAPIRKFMDKIHHIAIQVESIAKSVDWYKENFDITVSYQDETWAMIDFENTSLALVIPEQHPFHFAIESKDAGSYGELTEHRDGTASIYIKDIDGNNVEMIKLPDEE
jgi:hypothetical protein